jgi:hypothetical protein
MGYNFFEQVSNPDDLNMLEINEKGFDFSHLPANRRTHCFISYDFRVKHRNGNIFLINPACTFSCSDIRRNVAGYLSGYTSKYKAGNVYTDAQ